MPKDLLLQFIDFSVPVINLLCHLLDMPTGLVFIHLKVLDLLLSLLKQLIFFLNNPIDVLVVHIALLDLVFLAQNHR